MSTDFQVDGSNAAAPFTLRVHRGEGMALLAMNWKGGKPPADFVGFAIEYQEPGGNRFYPLNNRIAFRGTEGDVNPNKLSTRLSPIQKFRWVHFPRNANLDGAFVYRVTPVFMDALDKLSYGEAQEATLELRRETYPGMLNVTFTRGFVSSQAFVDRYGGEAAIATLLPAKAAAGLSFTPTHPNATEALAWMGFEAREAILAVLDDAIADADAQVRVVAYDLNEPGIVTRLEQLGDRVKVIIDDDGDHGLSGSAEAAAEKRLGTSAGKTNVIRQHMGQLQHNKTIIVDGPAQKVIVAGSTNFSWRGFFVQANNAVVIRDANTVGLFMAAFEGYWAGDVAAFGAGDSAKLTPLGLANVDVQVAFSPHGKKNAMLQQIADDIEQHTTTSLFFSLAFLYQTKGVIHDAIEKTMNDHAVFAYGISDHTGAGIDVLNPDGNVGVVGAAALTDHVPEPFKSEPVGGGGTRMHHKFVVIDFDTSDARVYTGSYNFSATADTKNGENLLLIRDRRIATAYMVEAIRIFDHYSFRIAQQDADTAAKELALSKPPRTAGELPWWDKDYTNPRRVRDRELFA